MLNYGSESRGTKGIALANITRFPALQEPAHTLSRRTMREGIGHDFTLGLPLQRIIADGVCGAQRVFNI